MGETAEVSELYVDCLLKLGKPDEALAVSREAFVKGKSSEKLVLYYREAFVKAKGSDSGFDAEMAAATAKRDDATRAKILKNRMNKPAADFTLKDMAGKSVSLASLKGKVVVIDFWATWCGPCKASFPTLQKVYDTLLGVPIRVHVTFLFLLFWFGAMSSEAGGSYLHGVVFLLLLFACVVLHELGHATMARRYGVKTSEIVLYPIGGVARLDRIPSGKAELLIASAGPLVNLVLAGLIWGGLQFAPVTSLEMAEELVGGSLVSKLFYANVSLFVFNLIPAFPMDGGRILRAALSMALGQDRATTIASRVGQGLAILFAVLAIFPPPVKPVLLLIALFVFLGAGQEEAYQRGQAAVKGLTARAAMVTQFATLAPQDSLGHAAELLLATHQQDFPVVDLWGRVAGVLSRAALIANLAGHGRDTAVLEAMAR